VEKVNGNLPAHVKSVCASLPCKICMLNSASIVRHLLWTAKVKELLKSLVYLAVFATFRKIVAAF